MYSFNTDLSAVPKTVHTLTSVVKQKQEGALCFIKNPANKLYIESYCQALHIKSKNTVVSVALTKQI